MPYDNELKEIDALGRASISGEMEEYTDEYKSIVLEKLQEARQKTPDAQLLIETRLDFGHFIKDSFGTADAIIIADGMMEVIDFKYGKGVEVSAVENPQMMIYALGAYDRFCIEYKIESVKMSIVQPRIDNISGYLLPVKDLLRWREEMLVPKARLAYAGEGLQQCGEWCKFCKVKGNCRVVAERCLDAVKTDPRLLSATEMAASILPELPLIKSWLATVEEYTLEQALSGVEYNGYKLVEGRSIRRITDSEGLSIALTDAGFDEADIYRPRELRNITDMEKLVGKKRFAVIAEGYIEKPQGKPTLVPDNDKRPAMNLASADFAGIEIE